MPSNILKSLNLKINDVVSIKEGEEGLIITKVEKKSSLEEKIKVYEGKNISKEFPTHYILKNTKEIKGSVLLEHIRSIDYEIRNFKFIEKVEDTEFKHILDLLNSLFMNSFNEVS